MGIHGRRFQLEERESGTRKKWQFVVASFNYAGLIDIRDSCVAEQSLDDRQMEFRIVGKCDHCGTLQTYAHIEIFER